MSTQLTVIVAVVMLGIIYVVVPVAMSAYRNYRGVKTLECPESGTPAEIELDAVRGAITAATGRPVLEVEHCSHWPEREHCGQECLAQLESPASGQRVA
jgi:hypothetical protein